MCRIYPRNSRATAHMIQFDPSWFGFLLTIKENAGFTRTQIVTHLEKNNIQSGLNLEKFFPQLKNCMIFCVTEMNTRQDIDALYDLVKKCKNEIYF